MNFISKTIIVFSCIFGFFAPTYGAENVFYVLHSKQIKPLQITLNRVKENKNAIHILISQAYRITSKGKVKGYINQELIDYSKANSIKLMAMVTNAGFNQVNLHQFLSSRKAQEKALEFIVKMCKEKKIYGVQFDFENVSIKDKKSLTRFYKMAALKLRQQKFAISFAVVPAVDDKPGPSLFLRKNYQNWTGAYDLKALGESGDFVTIMSYNQHPEGTTPGPLASVAWVEKTILHALKYMPAQKISLGIPAYSTYWYTGPNPTQANVSSRETYLRSFPVLNPPS